MPLIWVAAVLKNMFRNCCSIIKEEDFTTCNCRLHTWEMMFRDGF
jgi:hypothetical protein